MAVSQIEPKPAPVEPPPVKGATRGGLGPRHRLARIVEPMGGTRIVSAAFGGKICRLDMEG